MTRGLIWLPLLAIFIGLAWAGWNEYQKLEAYRAWAEQFDRAKYDIYAVLGQKGETVTWGKPTRKGPINLQTFSLQQVRSIQLLVDGQTVDLQNLPQNAGNVALRFELDNLNSSNSESAISVPFTDLSLAVKWGNYLQKEWQQYHNNQMGNQMG